mmetsp:Transcript_12671/g.39350  ORF Transcript_12671/g.39350 Transcript_12671/m.39350 type:complete len:603 (-) Transcript_12671:1204-3012(-)
MSLLASLYPAPTTSPSRATSHSLLGTSRAASRSKCAALPPTAAGTRARHRAAKARVSKRSLAAVTTSSPPSAASGASDEPAAPPPGDAAPMPLPSSSKPSTTSSPPPSASASPAPDTALPTLASRAMVEQSVTQRMGREGHCASSSREVVWRSTAATDASVSRSSARKRSRSMPESSTQTACAPDSARWRSVTAAARRRLGWRPPSVRRSTLSRGGICGAKSASCCANRTPSMAVAGPAAYSSSANPCASSPVTSPITLAHCLYTADPGVSSGPMHATVAFTTLATHCPSDPALAASTLSRLTPSSSTGRTRGTYATPADCATSDSACSAHTCTSSPSVGRAAAVMRASTEGPTAERSAMPPTQRWMAPSASAAAGAPRPDGSARMPLASAVQRRSAPSPPASFAAMARHSAPVRRRPRPKLRSIASDSCEAVARQAGSTGAPRAAAALRQSSSVSAEIVALPGESFLAAHAFTLSLIFLCIAAGLAAKHIASARSAAAVSAAARLCPLAKAVRVSASHWATTNASPPMHSSACSSSTRLSLPATAGPRMSSSRASSARRSAGAMPGRECQPPASPPAAKQDASSAFASCRRSSEGGAAASN